MHQYTSQFSLFIPGYYIRIIEQQNQHIIFNIYIEHSCQSSL